MGWVAVDGGRVANYTLALKYCVILEGLVRHWTNLTRLFDFRVLYYVIGCLFVEVPPHVWDMFLRGKVNLYEAWSLGPIYMLKRSSVHRVDLLKSWSPPLQLF